MKPNRLVVSADHAAGPVDERVFGGFIEHLGRCVYEGLYEAGSPKADADGCRKDVMAALKRLRMTAMRYPGGNFASGYHWQDGVGPADKRPKVRDLAWQSTEPNWFGTDEYMKLCRKMGWTPMLTANMGTGTPEEARNWIEYCNSPVGTLYSDRRAANGSDEPWGVKLWCLGNEMDGEWQLGHVPAREYAIRADQAAKMMKDTDPSIEVVAAGSCGTGMSTYMEWDREVLSYLGDRADFVSLHRYVGNREKDTPRYLATGLSVDKQIEEMDAACRFVAAKRRSKKRAFLCFDEWNVWYREMGGDGRGKFAPHLLEETYNLEDALVVASFFMSFLRHADCVKVANIAQVVNVIAPVMTRGPELLLQPIFFPFEMVSARRAGTALRTVVDGPTYETKEFGPVSFLDTGAILDGDTLHLFAVNRSTNESAPVEVDLCGRKAVSVVNAEVVAGPSPEAVNEWGKPEAVKAAPFAGVKVTEGVPSMVLPPLSFVAVTLKLGGMLHTGG